MKHLFVVAAMLLMNVCLAKETTVPPMAKPLAPQPHYADIAKKIARIMPKYHLLQFPMNEEISQKAWTNLMNAFDPDHSYFIQSDIQTFRPMEKQIAQSISNGDVAFAYDVHRLFIKRLEERYVFVTNQLARKLTFTENETYTWKRTDAPWPSSIEEQNELWRKRIKNELLSAKIAKELDLAAATNRPPVTRSATTNRPLSSVSSTTNNTPIDPPEIAIGKRYKQFMIVFQDMDEEAVLQRYISSLTMAYDPHSDYLSPMRKEDFDIDMNLSLCGIGAQLRSEDGMAKIMEIVPGGPADRDKRDIRLIPGDKIIAVGQGDAKMENIVHWPLTKAVRKIRGEKGTKVVLDVIPVADPSGTTTKRIDLIREEIKLEEQAATGRVERVTLKDGSSLKLGIIRLPIFYGTMDKRPNQEGFRSCTLDVARIIAGFNAENVSGLILDLRNNGGGSLREAIALTGLFIRSGPAVQVREISQIIPLYVPNADPAMAFRKPVIVMINRTAASASEIVAGALQDYGRAVIVGDSQTHGKGTVQTVMPIGSEQMGSIKLTTASFYRITGSSTQCKGVASDIIIPSLLDGLDIGEYKLPGALPWTKIEPASYIRVADVASFIPKLREKSAVRLSGNQKYARYCTLVRHAKEVSERIDVPLELEARRKIMKAENEIRKLEDEALDAEESSNVKKKKDEDDVIVSETLNILSDLIELTGGADVPMETDGDLHTRMLRIFGRDSQ